MIHKHSKLNSRGILALCVSVIGLVSCISDNPVKSAPNVNGADERPFYIRNPDNSITSKIDPDLLLAIQNHLVEAGRQSDAENLKFAYDFETGEVLQPYLKKAGEQIFNHFRFKAYHANQGWAPWSVPGTPYPSGFSSCATSVCTQQFGNPITAMIISGLPTAVPGVDLQWQPYYENQNGVGGWLAGGGLNIVSGPMGNLGRIKAFRAGTFKEGYHIWYAAHMGGGLGWLDWTYQFRDAGFTAGNFFMDGFMITLYRY